MRKKEPKTETERETKPEKQKTRSDKDTGRRSRMIFFMAVCGILEGALAGILKHQDTDRTAALVFFAVLYSVIFLAGMELYRGKSDAFYEKAGDYKGIASCYGLSCLAAVLFLFLPDYARPVLLLAVGMTMMTNAFFGLTAGMFQGAVFTLCGQENVYVLLCYILLLIGGCMAVSFLEKRENLRWSMVFLFLYTFGSILIFSYLQSGQLELNVLSYGLCNGILSAAGAGVLCQKLSVRMQVSRKQEMEKILREDFGLVRDVQEFSRADYDHARKVSEIAGNCARLIGADPYVAAAGGFYYRLGRMEGEPYVENGVALAKSNYLPKEIIVILSEYNGEQKLPSTVESAVVHIVDSVVAKFDVLDKTTLSSSWNQDILVYQTLNENSAAGLYDRAGFSMNMFLKIRDYLIKEAKLF